MRSNTVWACLVALVCLSGLARADFLAGGWNDNTWSGFAYLCDDAGAVKTTVWTGGLRVDALAMDPANGKIYMGLNDGKVHVTADKGGSWTYAFGNDTLSPRGLVIKNGVAYMSSWYGATLSAWDLNTNAQLAATPDLFQDLPGYPGAKFQQLIIAPASLNHEILGAAFYANAYGAGPYRWDGVNTDPATCVTKVAGVSNPGFNTGLAAVGNNTLYVSSDTQDNPPAISQVGVVDPTVGGTPAGWKDFGSPPFAGQLLAKNGKLYVANKANDWVTGQIDILSQADGSLVSSVPMVGVATLSDAVLHGDSDRNGKVEFADYQILEQHFGQSAGANWEDGDYDYDGAVTFADYQMLEQHFDQSVPEPATGVLLTLGLGGLVRRRGR